MNTKKKLLGSWGEELVAEYLEKKGYTIVALNTYARVGEIDLVAEKNDLLAFVEVKTRTTKQFLNSALITYSKQQKIIKTAKLFITQNMIENKACRFDIALVSKDENNKPVIDYRENAFYGN